MVQFPERADRVAAEGPHGTVEYAVRSDGSMDAKAWLDENESSKRSFGVLFTRLVTEGRITNTEQFRRIDGNIWEFKRQGHRILCIVLGNRRLLVRRFKKAGGKGKCPQQEIDHARTVEHEHIAFESLVNRKSRGL